MCVYINLYYIHLLNFFLGLLHLHACPPSSPHYPSVPATGCGRERQDLVHARHPVLNAPPAPRPCCLMLPGRGRAQQVGPGTRAAICSNRRCLIPAVQPGGYFAGVPLLPRHPIPFWGFVKPAPLPRAHLQISDVSDQVVPDFSIAKETILVNRNSRKLQRASLRDFACKLHTFKTMYQMRHKIPVSWLFAAKMLHAVPCVTPGNGIALQGFHARRRRGTCRAVTQVSATCRCGRR